MAPNGDSFVTKYCRSKISKPPRLSSTSIQRMVSDFSFDYDLSKEALDTQLPPISEVKDTKCECCGMCEECTPEYIQCVKDKFYEKLICGLCAEAVKEKSEKNGWKREDTLNSHMSDCVRFNKFGRKNPVLNQAQAMREILRKIASMDGRVRAKSISPRDQGPGKRGGIMRSSSCIPTITKDMTKKN